MDEADLIAAWSNEESQPFSGWDFGYLRRRYTEEKPPWSYDDLARDVLRKSASAVDLTGGGEVHPPNWTSSRTLPFPDAGFDAVLDRHEAYDAREVARVLAPGGVFLTQQVNGRSHADLLGWFGTEPHWPNVTLDRLAADLARAGLDIELSRSWWGSISFSDVGALVYYLRAIPWAIPDFSVERFKPELLGLQRRLDESGSLRFSEGRFVIRARKPR